MKHCCTHTIFIPTPQPLADRGLCRPADCGADRAVRDRGVHRPRPHQERAVLPGTHHLRLVNPLLFRVGACMGAGGRAGGWVAGGGGKGRGCGRGSARESGCLGRYCRGEGASREDGEGRGGPVWCRGRGAGPVWVLSLPTPLCWLPACCSVEGRETLLCSACMRQHLAAVQLPCTALLRIGSAACCWSVPLHRRRCVTGARAQAGRAAGSLSSRLTDITPCRRWTRASRTFGPTMHLLMRAGLQAVLFVRDPDARGAQLLRVVRRGSRRVPVVHRPVL